jgi:diaminopimelate epimerase
MNFTKMHGLGNDYVLVGCFDEKIEQPAKLAVAVSDRHRGIGSDGLILLCPSEKAAVRMRIFNADGSEAEMCGNGIRCAAKYSYERGLCPGVSAAGPGGLSVTVETGRGVLAADLTLDGKGRVSRVRVNMGEPILAPKDIPVGLPGEKVIQQKVKLAGMDLSLNCVSMGNPHAVFFLDEAAGVDLAKTGPLIENDPLFPRRTNVHFARIENRRKIVIRTWERGSGITMACGTGACAVCAAGFLAGLSDRSITAALPGGELDIEWNGGDNCVYMAGEAVEVFEGKYNP